MIGKRCLKIVEALITFTAFCRMNTFKWKGPDYVVATYPVTKIFWIFEVKCLGFWIINTMNNVKFVFGAVRIVQVLYDPESIFQDIMFQLFILSLSALCCVTAFNYTIKMSEIVEWYSAFVQYEKYLTRLYQIRPVKDRALPFILFFLVLALCELPGLTILYFSSYRKPVYFSSLIFYIPEEYTLIRYAGFFIFSIMEIMALFSLIFSSLLFAFVFILLVQSSRFWIEQLSPAKNELIALKYQSPEFKNEKPKTSPALRKFPIVVHTFRSWQLLIDEMNRCAAVALVGQHFIIAICLIFCAFSTIQFSGMHNLESIQSFICYAIYPAALAIFFIWVLLIQPQGADLTNACIDFCTKWIWCIGNDKPMEQRPKVQFIRSCRPMPVIVGCFFNYKTSTMPQVQNECVDKTISLLMGS